MDRRELLVRAGAITLWVSVSRVVVGCSKAEEGAGGPASLSFTSTADGGPSHSHRVALEVAILDEPPTAGLQPTTTEVNAHRHTLQLSQAELAAIRDNQVVMKMTSEDAGHSHAFTFRRGAGTATGGGSEYEPPSAGY